MASKDKFFSDLTLLKNNVAVFGGKFKLKEFKNLIKTENVRKFKEDQVIG